MFKVWCKSPSWSYFCNRYSRHIVLLFAALDWLPRVTSRHPHFSERQTRTRSKKSEAPSWCGDRGNLSSRLRVITENRDRVVLKERDRVTFYGKQRILTYTIMPVGKGDLEAGLPDFKDQVRSVAAHAPGAVAKKPHKPGATQAAGLPTFKDQAQSRQEPAAIPTFKDQERSHRDAASPVAGLLPTFKDQAQSRDHEIASPSHVGRPTHAKPDPPASNRASRGVQAPLPTFKDQARAANVDERASRPGARASSASTPEPSLPSYKDQVRNQDHKRAMIEKKTPPLEHAAHDDPEEPNGLATTVTATTTASDQSPALISARVVEEMSVFDALPMTGAFMVKRRQVIVGLAAILLLVAGVVGGVCGSGYCGGAGGNDLESNIQPDDSSARNFTEPPTVPSVLGVPYGTVVNTTIDYINSIKLSPGLIAFPILLDEATPEHLALWWLLEEDPLELSTGIDTEKTRLVQRYALLTLWYSLNGSSWGSSSTDSWLEVEDECTWHGVTCKGGIVSGLGDFET